jgi:3-phenylpropionate/trans-cinnamate dioxygenase ferredoxin reductase subunit
MAVQSAEEAKAALHGPALSPSSFDRNGQPTQGWLATFAAIAHARFSKAPDSIDLARRKFRELAEAAGALVRIHAVIRRGMHASEAVATKNPAPDARKRSESSQAHADASGANPSEAFRATSPPTGDGARKKRHRVRINGDEFWAGTGEVLLDAALRHGIDVPHDCRSGDCGACLVRVTDGQVSNGEAGGVHACQARVTSDIVVAVDGLPEVLTTTARVVTVRDISPEVVEVRVAPSSAITLRPGQYLNVRFGSLPARALSPTVCLDDPGAAGLIDFHVRRVPGGRLSTALGTEIRAGHRVKLTGPFGSAYLRSGGTCRLVLVAGETGFAPIWAIATVALQEQPHRELVLVVSSDMDSFYMEPALRWLAAYANVTVTCVGSASLPGFPVHPGGAAEHLPPLTPDDVVHVAGPLSLVDAVTHEAERAGALCHAEPYRVSAQNLEDRTPFFGTGLRSRARRWRSTWTRGPAPAGKPTATEGAAPLRRSAGPIRRLAAVASVLACAAAVLTGALQWYMTVSLPTTAAGSSGLSAPDEVDPASLDPDSDGVPVRTAYRGEQDSEWALRGEQNESLDGGGLHLTTNSTSQAPDLDPSSATPPPNVQVAGVWASHIKGCSPHENSQGFLPAVISPEGAWAGETTCAFRNRKETERGWDVVASCSNVHERWTAKVRLKVAGDRLVWSSRRGTQAYFRCNPGVRLANARPSPRD